LIGSVPWQPGCLPRLLLVPGPAALAQDLCGRPTEQSQALFDRLTKTENLKEDFRDKS